MGCLITGRPAEICHCIGKPSVTARIQEPKPRGKKLARHDWLVIPLEPRLHRLGQVCLDLNPKEFEATYGPVARMLDLIAERTGVDVWKLSQVGRK